MGYFFAALFFQGRAKEKRAKWFVLLCFSFHLLFLLYFFLQEILEVGLAEIFPFIEDLREFFIRGSGFLNACLFSLTFCCVFSIVSSFVVASPYMQPKKKA